MKPAISRIFGLLLAVLVSAAQGKVATVEWGGAEVPQVSTSAQVIYRSPAPQKNDGRSLKLLSAITGHFLIKPTIWNSLVAKVSKEQGDAAKLATANQLLNKLDFRDGTDGSWFHPDRLFKLGGVCKDFAVAKYLLLKDAGYDITKLRIVSMTPRLDHPDEALHVVLAALPAPNSAPVILDIKPLSERRAMPRKKGNQEAGLIDSEPTPGDSLRPLSAYSNRGLLWAGNESGVVSLKP